MLSHAASEGECVDRQERTQFAMQAIGLADLFRMMVGPVRISAPLAYTCELSAPEGPSTGGGKQSVQHIKLVPARGGATIVIGSADPVGRAVELRSWNRLAEIHAQRFGSSRLPVDQAQYAELLRRMQEFFAAQNLPVVVLDSPPPAPVTGGSGSTSLILIALGLAAVAAAVYFLTR